MFLRLCIELSNHSLAEAPCTTTDTTTVSMSMGLATVIATEPVV